MENDDRYYNPFTPYLLVKIALICVLLCCTHSEGDTEPIDKATFLEVATCSQGGNPNDDMVIYDYGKGYELAKGKYKGHPANVVLKCKFDFLEKLVGWLK